MKQFISKIIAEIIESCMLEDTSYKGKNYTTEQKQIVKSNELTLNEVDITVQGTKHNFIKCENEEQLEKKEGVYIFVAKEEISLLIKEAFIKFASVRIENNEVKIFYPCTPKINFYSEEKETISDTITLKQGSLIYVGEAKDLKNRYNRHYSSHINKTSALKLGLRECIKDKVIFYYKEIKDDARSNLEKDIRNEFRPRFGE